MTLIVLRKANIAIVVAAVLVLGLPSVAHGSEILLKEVSMSAETADAIKKSTFTLSSGSRKWIVPTKEARLWFKTRTNENGQRVLQRRPQAIYDYLNVHISP